MQKYCFEFMKFHSQRKHDLERKFLRGAILQNILIPLVSFAGLKL